MEPQIAQAFADFERFLQGESAPALVGHALAAVVRQDMQTIAERSLRHAYARRDVGRLEAVLATRDRVYEIFFYRVVRFRRVYDFFPRFERALIALAPAGDREAIADLFKRYPWQEIRPIGRFNSPRDLAIELRPEAEVRPDAFNEEIYRNATHQILSADRRYSFDDAALRGNVVEVQAQVTEVFDDFVSLIKDAILRREVMLSNVADRDLVYQDRPQFQIESYLGQLADLAIALFNDDFLEHSVQIFGIIQALAESSGIDIQRLERIHSKSRLVSRQRLVEYCTSRTGPILLRTVLTIFPQWRPEPLLDRLLRDEERSERELALTIFEAYGRDVYGLVVETLERCDTATPWHYRRNLAYLLGRLATDHGPFKARAVQALSLHLQRDHAHQLNLEVVSSLGALRSEAAVEVLVAKLAQFEVDFGKNAEATEICHRIVDTLVDVHTERSLRAAVDFCLERNVLDRHHEAFARVTLPESVRAELESSIRREVRKMRMSFSLLGDPYAVSSKLLALGTASQPDVAALCDEIIAAFPPGHELAVAATQVRDAPAPPPPLAYDRAFHSLLADRNLPEGLSYAFEAGLSGRLVLHTRGGMDCEIWLRKGEIWHAAVPALYTKEEDAFFWIFALEKPAITGIRFDPAKPLTDARSLRVPTPDLIREGLFRAKHVQQTIGGILSPESRFLRKSGASPDGHFTTLTHSDHHRVVWSALAEPADLKTIASHTGLSEYEIYRVLFDLLRENLISVEVDPVDRQLATIDDALTALDLFLRRIEAQPTYFQPYQSAAEICSYLASEAIDETIRSAAWALHTYLHNAFTLRRVLTSQSVEFCTRVLNLIGVYLRSGGDADRREVLDFLDIYLPEETRWPEPPQDEQSFIQSVLEQIENIDGFNDPFDAVAAPAQPVEVAVASIEESLAAPPPAAVPEGGARTPLEILTDATRVYVKPLRDFVRELERNSAISGETPAEWLEIVIPPLELLEVAAAKAGVEPVREAAQRLARAFKQQRRTGSDVLTPAFCRYVLVEYKQLVQILPTTFTLTATTDQVGALKDALIVKFLLRQVPEVDDAVVNKVLAAGFDSFGDLAETPPESLSAATGIAPALAEKIFMKIYQYEDLYYRPRDPSSHAKMLAFYAICLNVLKEIHTEVERAAQQPSPDPERKRTLLADRQRALWGLFALLCMRGDMDMIEQVQKRVFEQRIEMLDDYFKRLSEEPFPTDTRGRGA